MKKWLVKCMCLFIPVVLTVVLTNYFIDPANIYHASMADDIMAGFEVAPAVEIAGDFDEGALLEKRVASMTETPETIVIGSSHVLYVDWQFEQWFNAGMSGEFLDDYYATVGLLEEYNRLPEKLVIAVDPYIFMQGLSLRQDSLKAYAERTKDEAAGKIYKEKLTDKISFDKAGEIFSFSYFQSSAKALVNGADNSFANPTQDMEIGTRTKLLANGRRVPGESSFKGADQCRWDAEWYVSSGTIHVMSDFPKPDDEMISSFEKLIDYLLEKGVSVEIYLPGWFSIFYDEFAVNEKFAGVIKSEDYIRQMAVERGIIVHGSYNPYVAGITDEDFIDCLHLTPEAAWKNYSFVLQ